MKYCNVGGVNAPRLIVGCMRIADKPLRQVEKMIIEAVKNGVNMFDHADIYGGGDSEVVFGVAVKDLGIKREDVILQSKCGIRQGFYDFSSEHITSSVEGSLRRLNTEYLDFLLLHRPDALMEPEVIAETFAKLQESGKVRAFGVSNFSAAQLKLLRAYGVNVAVNQVQFSLMRSGLVDEGLNVNMHKDEGVQRGGELLDYCRFRGITLQAWSPLNYGQMKGVFVGNENFPTLNEELDRLAEKYGCTPAAIALAWILRHPAKMQVVCGTTTPERIAELCRSTDVQLEREEWYSLYRATGKTLP